MNFVISFTESGKELGEKLKEHLDCTLIYKKEFSGDIRELISENWNNQNSFIFISSTGIAIRYIKDYIVSKDVDPPIIVLDDMGKNVISLLSGHLGGGNELTLKVSEILNSNPVITTATDNRNIEGIDLFSRRHGYEIENLEDIKTISMLMLEEKTLGIYSKYKKDLNYKHLKELDSLENLENLDGVIIVSPENLELPKIPSIILRPKVINIGIGCKKDTAGKRIIESIKKELLNLNLSEKSIKKIGTVEAKKDEIGIEETAKFFNVEKKVFKNEEILEIEDMFEKSEFVKSTIGVYNVSEPCAYLLGGELLARKKRHNGITISIALEEK